MTVDDNIIIRDLNIIIYNEKNNNKIEITTNSEKEQNELKEMLLALQNCLLVGCANSNFLNSYRFEILQIINNNHFQISRNVLNIIGNYLLEHY